MDQIIDIIVKVLAMALVLGIGWVSKWLVAWLKSKLDNEQDAKLDLFIAEMVAAAEQIYKNSDPDGSIRNLYVQKMLVEAGYELTDAVRALIESKVFNINLLNYPAELELPHIDEVTVVEGDGND
jgi:hypothetical protein